MVRIMVAATLATTTFAVAVNSHALANKYPEYHKVWEDGALNKPLKKGFKARTPRSTPGLPTGKRQHKR